MKLSPVPLKGATNTFVMRQRRHRRGYPVIEVGWTDRPPRPEGREKSLRRCALYGLLPVPGKPGILAMMNRSYRAIGKSRGPCGEEAVSHHFLVEAARLDLRFAIATEAGWYLFSDGTAPWLSKSLEAKHARREGLIFKRVAPTSEDLYATH